jgi:signal transduction histidine kinase
MPEPETWKILLIDDEASIRNVCGISLRDAGYAVETAEDGEAGVRMCRSFLPHIVVTDIRMPRKDGIAVLEQVKKEFPGTEVIVVTAYGEMDTAIRALQLDASDFITKPVDDSALHIAVGRARRRYLDRERLEDYARFLEQEVENQAKILHRDKMMSLGRLAASIVHEINNPLAGILNYIRLMSRIVSRQAPSGENREQFARYLSIVEEETGRCSRIVSSLLSFSRRSARQFVKVPVDQLLEKCVLLCHHKLELCSIALHEHLEEGCPPISGDMNQLQQALINLVFNAIDAMPDGGRLDLSATFHQEAGEVALSVSDTGAGISEKDRPHVFEPFYTTKAEGYGTGLGLSTVFGIVESHGGSVGIQSAPGRGTTVTMRFPAAG